MTSTTAADAAATTAPATTAPVSADKPITLTDTLRIRNFRVLTIGQLTANIGGWTQRIAQDWLVLTLTGSAVAVGLVTALQFLPTLILGPYGGVLADRYPKRRILLITQSVLAACAVTLALLVLTDTIRTWHIFAVGLVLGAAIAIDNPTRQSFVTEVVGKPYLRSAISINSASFQLGALVGPAVSGVLIGLVGIGWSFAANAATFAVSLTALASLDGRRLIPTVRSAGRSATLGTAWRVVRADPHLWWPMVLAAVFALYTVNFPVLLTSFAADEFHSGATGLALLTSLMAIGSVIGSVLAARRSSLRLRSLLSLAALVVVVEGVAAAVPGLVPFSIMLVAVGICAICFGVSANSTVQMAVDDGLRGKVMSIYLLGSLGGGCIGGPLVGTLNELIGPRGSLAVGAGVSAVALIIVTLKLVGRTTPERRSAARDRVVTAASPTRLVRTARDRLDLAR
ncbi:MAG: MFS transporter [Nakamurella sp.]